jgi:hypothetical protein
MPLRYCVEHQNVRNDQVFFLLKQLFLYCDLEIHKENKLRYFYFLDESNIFLEKLSSNLIYRLDIDGDEDYQIRQMMKHNSNYLFIHPLLFSKVKISTQSLKTSPKSIRYISWSIGMMILIFILKINVEILKEIYYQTLENNFSRLIFIENILLRSGYKCDRRDIILVEKLLNCLERTDEMELRQFFLSDNLY